MSICHLIFPHGWHMKGLISIEICVLVSLCVTFYPAYMFLALLCFLMKFCKGDLHEAWHSHQTHLWRFGIRRSVLSHLTLEGNYKNIVESRLWAIGWKGQIFPQRVHLTYALYNKGRAEFSVFTFFSHHRNKYYIIYLLFSSIWK